ncbi:polysaccharide deacetylase family protein [Arthrobacter sp. NPDC090010]|uniref:polysaccharide deacetylase family protein n=1 Tax=Arthrobacter sp. NPDC090010 TaxID=3363942 RepID=UPI00382A6967
MAGIPAPVSRRALLHGLGTAAAGVGLVSCGVPAGTSGPASTPGPGPNAGGGRARPRAATESVVPRRRLPSKASILREFGGRVPKQWGLDVTGVAGGSKTPFVVLSFDLCGGPGGSRHDGVLFGTLRRLAVPATFFVNARWAKANPGLLRDLAHDPLFEFQNHGWRHRPLSVNGSSAYGIPGTEDLSAAYDEVARSQEMLGGLLPKPPQAFRPGTAYYDEITAAMVRRLGLLPANFSVNADAGATFPADVVARELAAVKPGDVVISHANQPGSGTAPGYAAALPGLLARGVRFAHLSTAFHL